LHANRYSRSSSAGEQEIPSITWNQRKSDRFKGENIIIPRNSVWKTRLVEGSFPDRSFDIEFWQEQGDEAIFSAAWEMVELAGKSATGENPRHRAGRGDGREHTASLGINLLDAILGNLKQVLAVECRSCVRGDIDRAHCLAASRIEGIQIKPRAVST
jgi:hypothetical protein